MHTAASSTSPTFLGHCSTLQMAWTLTGKEEATQRGISSGKIKQGLGTLVLVKRKWRKVPCLQKSDSGRTEDDGNLTTQNLNINRTPLSAPQQPVASVDLQDATPHIKQRAPSIPGKGSASFSSDTLQGWLNFVLLEDLSHILPGSLMLQLKSSPACRV